ncbi:hypothetical protein NDU88_002615 [Pleurodeles waltl]|uniref:Uncharacterized protein n=1 Tax=Pleurodeles waltl TaxID=8319 RepID=A0AAV7SER3_PLEWA|nr:hypothetical protein NDU88_002615 [Pleurodeles waltl]
MTGREGRASREPRRKARTGGGRRAGRGDAAATGEQKQGKYRANSGKNWWQLAAARCDGSDLPAQSRVGGRCPRCAAAGIRGEEGGCVSWEERWRDPMAGRGACQQGTEAEGKDSRREGGEPRGHSS